MQPEGGVMWPEGNIISFGRLGRLLFRQAGIIQVVLSISIVKLWDNDRTVFHCPLVDNQLFTG